MAAQLQQCSRSFHVVKVRAPPWVVPRSGCLGWAQNRSQLGSAARVYGDRRGSNLDRPKPCLRWPAAATLRPAAGGGLIECPQWRQL